MSEEESQRIRIYCRVRPVADRHSEYEVDEQFEASRLRIFRDRGSNRDLGFREEENARRDVYQFQFDGILGVDVKQPEVFDRCAKDCVLSALDGFNSTIFAYGQTGSGKTWTMTGGDEQYFERGILPRSLALIFDEIKIRTEANPDAVYTVSIAYMEIYQNKGYDLLAAGRNGSVVGELKDLPRVRILEDDVNEFMVLRNLRWHRCAEVSDAIEKLWEGDCRRVVCETEMNPNSSRSHTIFTVTIEHRPSQESARIQCSKLHLVDLAGSERVHKLGVEGRVLQEAKGINLSLHCLERVIVALSENHPHKPYRNSLLTHVLKDSIGGNCRTVMIANVNPSINQFGETVSTCKFAQRVASVVQVVHRNERLDPAHLIRHLRKRVRELTEQLAFYKNQGEQIDSELDANQTAVVRSKVIQYCSADDDSVLDLGGDYRRFREAFRVFRSIINQREIDISAIPAPLPSQPRALPAPESAAPPPKESEPSPAVEQDASMIRNLQAQNKLHQVEIDLLVSMLAKKTDRMRSCSVQVGTPKAARLASLPLLSDPIPDAPPTIGFVQQKVKDVVESVRNRAQATAREFSLDSSHLDDIGSRLGVIDRAKAYQKFRQSYRKQDVMQRKLAELQVKFDAAKKLGLEISEIRAHLTQLKARFTSFRVRAAAESLVGRTTESSHEEESLKGQILRSKEEYDAKKERLVELKMEIMHAKRCLEKSRMTFQRDFEAWFQTFNFRREDEAPEVSGVSTAVPRQISIPDEDLDRLPSAIRTPVEARFPKRPSPSSRTTSLIDKYVQRVQRSPLSNRSSLASASALPIVSQTSENVSRSLFRSQISNSVIPKPMPSVLPPTRGRNLTSGFADRLRRFQRIRESVKSRDVSES